MALDGDIHDGCQLPQVVVLAREDNLWQGQAEKTFQWFNAGSNQSRAPAQCNPAQAISLTWDHMEAAKVEYATATKVAGSEAQDTVSAAVEVNDFALQLPGTAIQAESLADRENRAAASRRKPSPHHSSSWCTARAL